MRLQGAHVYAGQAEPGWGQLLAGAVLVEPDVEEEVARVEEEKRPEAGHLARRLHLREGAEVRARSRGGPGLAPRPPGLLCAVAPPSPCTSLRLSSCPGKELTALPSLGCLGVSELGSVWGQGTLSTGDRSGRTVPCDRICSSGHSHCRARGSCPQRAGRWCPGCPTPAPRQPCLPIVALLLGLAYGDVNRPGSPGESGGRGSAALGEGPTHLVQVEGARAHEGHGVVQVVVVHAVLVVLEGHHAEGEGPHAARAPVGQPHLQAHRVTDPAGRRLAVTGLSVHQHVCRDTGHQSVRAPATGPPPPITRSSTSLSCRPCCASLGEGHLQGPAPALLTYRLGVLEGLLDAPGWKG